MVRLKGLRTHIATKLLDIPSNCQLRDPGDGFAGFNWAGMA